MWLCFRNSCKAEILCLGELCTSKIMMLSDWRLSNTTKWNELSEEEDECNRAGKQSPDYPVEDFQVHLKRGLIVLLQEGITEAFR